MQRVGACLRNAGVAGIYLVHGTFVGADASGAVREIARMAPGLGQQLRGVHKQTIDRLTRDAGNYTPDFAAAYEEGLQTAGAPRLPVRLLHWSGENHHIGRADGAIRLLSELATERLSSGQRWLIWGHSHGGNLLALISNLLASEPETVEQFFRAARTFYRWPLFGKVDLPIWTEVAEQLRSSKRPWSGAALDLVTFGTPIRYGWDVNGCGRLLHFVHHRTAGLEVPFPPSIDDFRHAASGDLMQLLGVAGTNLPPTIWAWRAWLADRRLGRLLQAGIHKRDLLSRLRAGQRAHDAGVNLLVDYGPIEGSIGQHHAGHAIYTRQRWLLFHAEETACRLYGMDREAENGSDAAAARAPLRPRRTASPNNDGEDT